MKLAKLKSAVELILWRNMQQKIKINQTQVALAMYTPINNRNYGR